MAKVRRENSDVLEYVCPECGETFDEGAERCSSCGLEFDWSEELEYLCPECGTLVDPDSAQCPGCSAKFSKEENGDVLIEYEPDDTPPTVEEMLDAAIDEVMVHPVETVTYGRTVFEPPEMEESTKEGPGPSTETARATKARDGTEATADEGVYEGPKLYPGGFTRVGLVFVTLAIMALVFTVVMARYDTWIQGEAVESMGDNQRMMFFAGLGIFAICILIAVADLLRAPKRAKDIDRGISE